jgi:hypothetical protein
MFVSAPALAFAEWKVITTEMDRSFYADVGSMRKNEYGAALSTLVSTNSMSIVSTQEIICKVPKRIRVRESTVFSDGMGKGSVLRFIKEPAEWLHEGQLKSDSPLTSIIRWICDGNNLSQIATEEPRNQRKGM